MNELPRLRAVEVTAFEQDGRPMLFLRDRLALSDKSVALPQALGPALALADGTRDIYAIQAGLVARYGITIRVKTLQQLFQALDEVYLLDNSRSERARRAALEAYRAAPYRPPALAGGGYPAASSELKAVLDGYLAAPAGLAGVAAAREGGPAHEVSVDPSLPSPLPRPRPNGTGRVRGIVSPHIDYARGGPVYAAVWGQPDVVEAAREADLVVVLGTDHNGGPGRLTLTRQSYATPYGVLPSPKRLVDELAEALGQEEAFEEELHHRTEHSIELAVTWLHHVRNGSPVEVLPVLCGSFHHFSHGDSDPGAHQGFAAAVEVLLRASTGRRTLVVAAADLAHVGPAFGGDALDAEACAALRVSDDEILGTMQSGEAGRFFRVLRRSEDANNVCGLPPIYLALRLLAPVTGETIAYDQCPADDEDTSWVSVAGLIWR